MNTNRSEKIEYLKNLIKFLSANRGYSLTSLALDLNKHYGRKKDMSNLSAKLRRGSLSILEFAEILELLEYELDFKDLRKYQKKQ